METIIKAYYPAKSGVQHSLSKLTLMLGFESHQDCSSFCNQYGLSAELESDIVYMEKVSFFYPESSSASGVKHAKNLVESKRYTQWSVAINGNIALPNHPYLTYVPHDSFDPNGFLKPEALDGSDQLKKDHQSVNIVQENQEHAKKSQEMAIIKVMEQLANEMLNEIILDESIKQS